MPVETPCAEYDKNSSRWERCRWAIEGEDAIKLNSSSLVACPSDYSPEQYKAYTDRGNFFGATGRTLEGLLGAILRKEGTVTVPKKLESDLESLGRRGEGLRILRGLAAYEKLAVGRSAFMVDQERGTKGKQYITVWCAEDVISWREEVIDRALTLTRVVLREVYDEVDELDRFKIKERTRYRVLNLGAINLPGTDEAAREDEISSAMLSQGKQRVYSQEIWEEDKAKETRGGDKKTFIHVETIVPKLSGGKLLDEIPFYFCGDVSVEKPPLLDLVNVNISHFRNSCDLEHGLHFTGLPTPWAAGFKPPKDGTLLIGSTTAWISPEPTASCGFLEFTGQGLSAISGQMTEKKAEMAVLGARLLEPSRAGVEASETVRLRQSGEHSVLSNIADDVGEALTKAVRMFARWRGGIADSDGKNITIALNNDFNPSEADPQLLTILFAALQGGKLSPEVWFFNLQRGEISPEGWSFEDEQNAIAASGMGEADEVDEDSDDASADPAPSDASNEEEDDVEDPEDSETED